MNRLAIRKKRSRVGLAKGIIDWQGGSTLVCIFLGECGMHAKTIADATGLTVAQVYNRCKRIGLRLRDYRDGNSKIGSMIIRKCSVKSISKADLRKLQNQAHFNIGKFLT